MFTQKSHRGTYNVCKSHVTTGKETLSCNPISFDIFSHSWHMLLGEHVIWLRKKREAVFWQWDNKMPCNSEIVKGRKGLAGLTGE